MEFVDFFENEWTHSNYYNCIFVNRNIIDLLNYFPLFKLNLFMYLLNHNDAKINF